MSFSIDDYERAIACIFNSKGVSVGTGFLVAPGYILTCAHVVLQAIGIQKDRYAEYQDTPTELISLEFPVIASGHLKAKIVEWIPYSSKEGDVAGLKLLGAISEEIKPISIQTIQDGELNQGDIYWASNYTVPGGCRSDDYTDNGLSDDSRIRFRKKSKPDDETIVNGFSGAPIWNDTRKCVIGMLATARQQKNKDYDVDISKAYGIPKVKLESILKKLSAYSLDDILQRHLESLNNDSQKKLRGAIEKALRFCDPGQDWILEGSRREKLTDLSQKSYPGWSEVDGLTQFSIFLATIEGLTPKLFDQIQAFVEFCEPNLEFARLLSKATREKLDCNVSSRNPVQHLIIEVIPQEQSQGVRLSIWDTTCSSPLVQDKTLNLDELPNFLETWLEEESEFTEPTLHIFVRRDWLHFDFGDRPTHSELTLGSQYKLLMRTHLNLVPTGRQYYKRLQQKWAQVEKKVQQTAQTVFVRADCSSPAKLFQALKSAEMAILDNVEIAKFAKILDFVAKKTALPVVLWSRRGGVSDGLDYVLECQVVHLPERILEERCNSLTEDENHIGRHLTLIWEDPNVMPPTLQFDSEAC